MERERRSQDEQHEQRAAQEISGPGFEKVEAWLCANKMKIIQLALT